MNFLNKKRSILKESKKAQQPEKTTLKEQNKNLKISKEIKQDQPTEKEVKAQVNTKLQQESDDSIEVETIVEQTKEQKKAQKKELKRQKKLQKLQEQQEEEQNESEEEDQPKMKEVKQKQNQNNSKVASQTTSEQSDKKSKKQEQTNKGKAEAKQEVQEKIEPKIVKKPKITIIEEDDSEDDFQKKKQASKFENKTKDSDSEEMEEEFDGDSDLEELRRVKKQMNNVDNEDDDSEEENFKDISSDDEHKNKKQSKNKLTLAQDKKNQQQNNKNQLKKVQQTTQVRNLNEKIKLKHLAICIPDSIISIPQSSELRSYFISELARTAAIFCVDEIIILKDNSYIAKSQNFQQGPYIARNLQYLETPQYLRKQLFPIHPDLKNAGLMNPIECHHHLKSDQYCPYREGVVMNRPVKENDGSWVEIGLKKQAKIPYKLATNTRVTLRINEPTIEIEQKSKILYIISKNYSAEVVSQKEPQEKLGLFWGYQVRLADDLNQVFKGGHEIKYDAKFLINQGDHQQFSDESILETDIDFNNKKMLINIFSGYNNIESIVDSDEYSKLSGKDALLKFDANFTMQKGRYGVKQLRLEEEMAHALSIVRRLFN